MAVASTFETQKSAPTFDEHTRTRVDFWHTHAHTRGLLTHARAHMRTLRNLHERSTKEPYKRDVILQKRPIILRSLLLVAPLQIADFWDSKVSAAFGRLLRRQSRTKVSKIYALLELLSKMTVAPTFENFYQGGGRRDSHSQPPSPRLMEIQ